ncbi:MAG TPA: hypothetical protein EYP91_22590 [Gammaproteobacteria bacterium]|jgi:molybdopterin converting factor small subunit|nr:hypothetical protein [Gammaproteobacteria bacterium]
MAIVIFSSELQKLTGEQQTRVDAEVFKDIVTEISNQYSALEHDELMKMAVAIDGEIIHTPFLEKVAATSEVHFLYRISGG